jgi:hypothetical protein
VLSQQIPIGVASEQRVNMLVADRLGRAIKDDVAQATHTRHQLDAEQPAQAEDRLALTLDVCVQRAWLDLGAILQQPVQDMDGLPDAARDKTGEQGDVAVGDVMVTSPSSSVRHEIEYFSSWPANIDWPRVVKPPECKSG